MIDTTPRPPRAGDWPDLAAFAAQLQTARRDVDPRSVEAGRMTQAQADTRARVIDAVAAIWSAVAARRNVADPEDVWTDTLGAQGITHWEIRADLATASARAANDAAFDPTNREKADRAALLAALVWWHEPMLVGGCTPRILVILDLNIELRAAAQAAREGQQRKAA